MLFVCLIRSLMIRANWRKYQKKIVCDTMAIEFVILILCFGINNGLSNNNVTRQMYDGMSQLVGDNSYSDSWWKKSNQKANKSVQFNRWNERQECFNRISPGLTDTLDLAWQVSQKKSKVLISWKKKLISKIGNDKILEFKRTKRWFVDWLSICRIKVCLLCFPT